MTDAETDCVPSPQPQTRKERKEQGKGRKRERERAKPDLCTQWAFWASSGMADA